MMLPEENFGRQLSRLIVMSTGGEVDPVPINEDGISPDYSLKSRISFLMIFLGFEHISRALFGEQVTKLLPQQDSKIEY